mgnify:CR=1 FL=1
MPSGPVELQRWLLVGVEGGGRVGGGDAVAGVAADGADVADLGAAHLVHGLSQNMEVFLDQGIPGNVGKAGERADPQGAVCLQGHAPEFIQPVDGDQLHTGPLALPHLHQHVGSTGDDLGIRMGHPEGHRVLNALRLIQGFHIIHEWFPPLVFDQPSLFEPAVEDMGRDRACVKGHTCGVQDGVADGRRRRTGRGLAQGLGAVGRGGLRVFRRTPPGAWDGP